MKAIARAVWLLSICVAGSAAAQKSQADVYPSKPVRFVVPFSPGGSQDSLARLFSQKLAESTGQQFVVDNRGGAGGSIAATMVARAPADGYTILIAGPALISIAPAVNAKLPFDPGKDLTPVTQLINKPFVLLVNPSLPIKTVPELVAYARANPNKLNYATPGQATVTQVITEQFRQLTGLEMTHVPYKGAGPAMIDVISGQVQLMFTSIVSGRANVQSGRLRAIALTGNGRSAMLPDVPTLTEAGVKGMYVPEWTGVFTTAGVPSPIVATLQREFARALQADDVRKSLTKDGATGVGSTPAEFAAVIRAELPRMAAVIKAANIRIQ